MNFTHFKSAVAKQFDRMSKHDLFRADVSGDALWDTYLNSYLPEDNPIYRTRREYDCACCRQFIRAVGNVVAFIDGKPETIWSVDLDELGFQRVALAMEELVLTAPVTDAFLHYEKTAGTNKNFEQLTDGSAKAWEHFFVNIPAKFVLPEKQIPTKLNEHRTAHAVFKRGLEEITMGAIDTVLELIKQGSLYRGEEQKFVLTEFKKLKTAGVMGVGSGEAFTWPAVMVLPGSVSRIRNTSIGTLLVALSEGTELEDAVKAFESVVAPASYKRPTALVTKAMVDKAKAAVEELGLTSALERRYATLADISVNNVLFADRSARKLMADSPFDGVATKPVSKEAFLRTEEVSIDKFLADILPSATSLEVMFENQHASNLVSLVAPADATALPMFKWSNRFSWSYNGDVADSIKERVKKAGGAVEGDLCCRLAWDYADDLDFHMTGPGGEHVYYGCRRSPQRNGGMLDVDANGCDGLRDDPCENIVYADKRRMADGVYKLAVNNWCRRSPGTGFEVEIDCEGQVHHMSFAGVLGNQKTVNVAEIAKSGLTLTVKCLLDSTAISRDAWGLKTQQFHRVNALMLSPNHWDGEGVGNKHYFFMLDGCRNEGQARGFYNEFLRSDLDVHRRVLEMVGAKMKTETGGEQLSGLGFSSTQRNAVLCKVSGAFSRVIKIVF